MYCFGLYKDHEVSCWGCVLMDACRGGGVL